MPRVGFEITIPASERAKTVDALDRSATVTGHQSLQRYIYIYIVYIRIYMYKDKDVPVLNLLSTIT
jgi:hypothetical protein